MSLTYPDNPFVDGDIPSAARWNGKFTAIQQKFGNITGDDIAVDANIPGSAIAANTLPGDRIVDRTITQGKIVLLAVGTPELALLAVTKAKIATATADQITSAQINETVQVTAFGDTVTSGEKVAQATPSPVIPTASRDVVGLYLASSMVVVAGQYYRLILTTSGGNYVAQVVANGAAGSFSGTVAIVHRAKT